MARFGVIGAALSLGLAACSAPAEIRVSEPPLSAESNALVLVLWPNGEAPRVVDTTIECDDCTGPAELFALAFECAETRAIQPGRRKTMRAPTEVFRTELVDGRDSGWTIESGIPTRLAEAMEWTVRAPTRCRRFSRTPLDLVLENVSVFGVRRADDVVLGTTSGLFAIGGEPAAVTTLSPRSAPAGALRGDTLWTFDEGVLHVGPLEGTATASPPDPDLRACAPFWSNTRQYAVAVSSQTGQVYVATDGGRLARFDPSTETWTTLYDTQPVDPMPTCLRGPVGVEVVEEMGEVLAFFSIKGVVGYREGEPEAVLETVARDFETTSILRTPSQVIVGGAQDHALFRRLEPGHFQLITRDAPQLSARVIVAAEYGDSGLIFGGGDLGLVQYHDGYGLCETHPVEGPGLGQTLLRLDEARFVFAPRAIEERRLPVTLLTEHPEDTCALPLP